MFHYFKIVFLNISGMLTLRLFHGNINEHFLCTKLQMAMREVNAILPHFYKVQSSHECGNGVINAQ